MFPCSTGNILKPIRLPLNAQYQFVRSIFFLGPKYRAQTPLDRIFYVLIWNRGFSDLVHQIGSLITERS